MGDFLDFRTLISGHIIKILYPFGAMVITIFGVFLLGLGSDSDGESVGLGLAIVIGGNVLWRLMCESWILFYSIHDHLVSTLHEIQEPAVASALPNRVSSDRILRGAAKVNCLHHGQPGPFCTKCGERIG